MKCEMLFISCIVFAMVGCATETLTVKVFDNDGNPVPNATVSVGFSKSSVVFGGGHSASGGGKAMSRTDTNGVAVVKFDCTSSDFGWHVEADGYYRGNSHNEHFDFEDVIIPPCFGKVILHEHEKSGVETLYKIKNPQQLVVHNPIERRKVPKVNGRYGFDLAEYDWLPPEGRGKTADFYLVRDIVGVPDSGEYNFGRIEFEKDCGYYIGKQTGSDAFPAVYHAGEDSMYQTNVVLRCIRHNEGNGWTETVPVVGEDEYLVLRTRVRQGENGCIQSANYSLILGRFTATSMMSAARVVFNPRVNDTNLEYVQTK